MFAHLYVLHLMLFAITVPALLDSIIGAAIMLGAPALAMWLARKGLNFNATIDNWPSWVKQIVAGTIGAALTALGALLNMQLPTDLASLLSNNTALVTLVGGVLTLVYHHFVKVAESVPTPPAIAPPAPSVGKA